MSAFRSVPPRSRLDRRTRLTSFTVPMTTPGLTPVTAQSAKRTLMTASTEEAATSPLGHRTNPLTRESVETNWCA
jgi:hypothetical protein